jgi:hypothetical protein
MLYGTKIAEWLSSQGKLDQPAQDFETFQIELWNASKDTIHIRSAELNKIN